MVKKQERIISFSSNEREWEPWDKYMKGAPANDAIPNAPAWDGNFGGWVKVLSTPENGDGWTFLVRHVPPPGMGIRFNGISKSREQCYCVYGSKSSKDGEVSLVGEYSFLQAETIHGGILRDEVIHLIHYDGDPDEIMRYEAIN